MDVCLGVEAGPRKARGCLWGRGPTLRGRVGSRGLQVRKLLLRCCRCTAPAEPGTRASHSQTAWESLFQTWLSTRPGGYLSNGCVTKLGEP